MKLKIIEIKSKYLESGNCRRVRRFKILDYLINDFIKKMTQ